MHLEHNGPRVPGGAPLPKNDWAQWIDAVTEPVSHNGPDWGLKDTKLPLITLEKFGAASAGDILAATRREGVGEPGGDADEGAALAGDYAGVAVD